MKVVIATAIFFLAFAVTVQGIEGVYEDVVQSASCDFSWRNLFLTPVITLRADNGKYLSRIWRGGVNYIEAAKTSPDVFCEFKAIRVDGNTFAFVGDNGRHLSRIYRGGINGIESEKKEIDIYSQFEVSLLDGDLVTLKADNGLYLSRINRGYRDPVEAAKSSADVYSQFTINIVRFE